MKERGLSAIVATVLVILLVIGGVTIVWVGVLPLFDGGFGDVNMDVSLDVVSSGQTVWDSSNRLAMVQVERGADESDLIGMDLIFNLEDRSVMHYVNRTPDVNAVRTYYVNLSNYSGELFSVGVAGVFVGGIRGPVLSELEVGRIDDENISEMIENDEIDGDLFEEPNGNDDVGGGDDGCVVTSLNDSPGCYGDDVYWFNNCGDVGLINESCSDGCSDGVCKVVGCIANCTGKVCGNDDCGESCPPGCGDGFYCSDGECLEGEVYYVSIEDGDCDDSGNGTSEIPWCNLSRAYTWYSGDGVKVAEGDTVLFRDGDYGNYYETSVERTDWITYKADVGHSPEFTTININWNGPSSNKYLRFDGITIRPELDDGNAISVRYSNHTQFLNLNVIGQGARYSSRGFNARYSNYILVENNTFSGGNKIGIFDGFSNVIYTRDSSNIIIINNEITQFHGNGIQISNANNIIKNNNIHRFSGDAGIFFGGGPGPMLIENNKIHDITLYYPALDEITTDTTWSADGLTMTNPNANWNAATEPYDWIGNMELYVISGTNVLIGDGSQHGDQKNFDVANVNVDGTQITLTKSIADGGGPINVDYKIRDRNHADLMQHGAGSQSYNVTIRGNELYDSLDGWAYMHLQPLDYDNPDLNIGGFNWLIENNFCWNLYPDGTVEYGTPLNVRHIDDVIFRNNTVIGRVQIRDNKNAVLYNNIISYLQPYGVAGIIDSDYNIVNRGGFSTYPSGENNLLLQSGEISEVYWNASEFTDIFRDYASGNFAPASDNIVCNGSYGDVDVAWAGALGCVCV